MAAQVAGAQPDAFPPLRARELGLAPGIFSPGPRNAITDVVGVRVGHATVVAGDSLRTGVTVVVPHAGNLFRDRVPAALAVGNGFGKLLGATQLAELGQLETPIALTCTLCIWSVGEALARALLDLPGMQEVRSINPVVGETNDGALNATRLRPGMGDALRTALARADSGAVAEGSVGAGTGTVMFGWKGGIGTASRRLPASLGGWTVGVLVQGNYGGVLEMAGVPIGRALGQYAFRAAVDPSGRAPDDDANGDGSVMIVVATDAPLLDRNLRRLASRSFLGLAHTGSSASNGSGDYALAFSTHPDVRSAADRPRHSFVELANDELSPLFQAVVEATEEALYNALLMATPVSTRVRRVDPLPRDSVRALLRARGIGTPR
ncbi:MAG: P1 family peptidase [Gemmatimonadaceae bacterium]|nr:P1 family peptidase [Gemmatimonadaceae bacterium]